MSKKHENQHVKIASGVTDEKLFIHFLELFTNDRENEIELEKSNQNLSYSSGTLGWENILIEQFLERASV